MSESAQQPILRRKLAERRPPRVSGQGTVEHLLATTMPRDANNLFGLRLRVSGTRSDDLTKAELVASIRSDELIYLLEGDRQPAGICVLSSGLLSALIEIQFAGRVSATAPRERTPTALDGIMACDVVDRWIASARGEGSRMDILHQLPFARHNRSRMVPDARHADLALDPLIFSVLEIELDVFDGVKSGSIRFAVPARQSGMKPVRAAASGFVREVIGETETALSVVLARVTRPLDYVGSLAVGDSFELPLSALGEAALVDSSGRVLARGALGQQRGQKAVRLRRRNEPGVDADEKPGRDFVGATALTRAPEALEGKPTAGSTIHAPAPASSADEPSEPPGASDVPDRSDLPDLPGLPD